MGKEPTYTGIADITHEIIEPSGIDIPTQIHATAYNIDTKLCSIYKDIFHYFFFTVTCAAHLCIYMCT
jgi:hypothetical protein